MKRRTLAPDRTALAAEIAGLSKAGIANLRERWKTLYGKQPPGCLGTSFLIRAIAYRLQEQACGSLKPSTRRLLARVAEEAAAGSSPKRPPVRKAEMGTILVRQWQGNAHRVTGARRRRVLQRQALSFALGSRARDHGQSLVGATVLRAEVARYGEQPWNALKLRPAVAPSTPANLPKKD
jgi:hypothetical protein